MMIYLDHAATTKPCEQAVSAITACLTEYFGNPSSLHHVGLDAQLQMDHARSVIAESIGAAKEEILFTSGATESSNLALRGAASIYGKRKKHIVTSAVEHASVRSTIDDLEKNGFSVTRVYPDENGVFCAEDFLNAVTDETFLVSMMIAENETGHILPVGKVFRVLKKKHPQIVTHCDAVQAYMKLPVHVDDLYADLMSVSGHKIHGPKGTGALYIRKGIRLSPLVTGGKQEKAIRPGTESVPLICGFGAAAEMMRPTIGERFTYVSKLRDDFLCRLAELPFVSLHSTPDCSPYIVNFSVDGIRSEIMLHYLESKEIYVSSGSACSKGARSGVLSAYGVSDKEADCAIRVSFCGITTESDLSQLIEAIIQGHSNLIHRS